MNIHIVCPICDCVVDVIITDEIGDDIRVLSKFACEDCFFGDEDVYRKMELSAGEMPNRR